MSFLSEKCTFRAYDAVTHSRCEKFYCGHDDLDEFFREDCIKWSKELLGKTYCFTLDSDPQIIVCAFTVSNDSIKTNLISSSIKNKINRPIPYSKRTKSYPAVLIGRLGVNKEMERKNIGSELMDFIKSWFIDKNNKTGCRFIVVDAYNTEQPLAYYKKNGFEFLFPSEDDEKKYNQFNHNVPLRTRLMKFDLILLRSGSSALV